MASIGSFASAVREAVTDEDPLTVEFEGEKFTLASTVPMLPFMRFAKVAAGGADTDDAEAMAAMYVLMRGCLKDDAEFNRFEETALRHRTDGETIFEVCSAVYEGIMNRPTSPSSDSSAGRLKNGKSSSKKSAGVALPKNAQTVALPDDLADKRAANEDPDNG